MDISINNLGNHDIFARVKFAWLLLSAPIGSRSLVLQELADKDGRRQTDNNAVTPSERNNLPAKYENKRIPQRCFRWCDSGGNGW